MTLRLSNLARLQAGPFDVLIVGGGINGAVSAAALAAAGVRVALIDRGDFAGETSSNSSNLAWGGIKYLESGEWLLVERLCRSRNRLMRAYPSTVREIRFLASIQRGFRWPVPMLYLGTLVYWLIGRCFTQAPHYLTPSAISRREPLIATTGLAGGFEYSDCYLQDNDARFVFNFIRSALDFGGVAVNYVESLGAQRQRDRWLVPARDRIGGRLLQLSGKVLINACGPWVDEHNQLSGQRAEYRHLFSKGVHLVVDRITSSPRVLTFFASDGRLFFVMPMGPRTCIGTTDTQVECPKAVVTDEDRQFILDNANRLLQLPEPLTLDSIIAERSGVRPLVVEGSGDVADWMKLSRRHVIDVDAGARHLSIFGGKLTDCLNVGDEVVAAVARLGIPLPQRDRIWYGEPEPAVHQRYLDEAARMQLDTLTPASSSEPLTSRLWRRYGATALEVLAGIREHPEWAELLIENAEYIRGEVEIAARREMITKLEDFLRRRSRIAQVVRHEALIDAPGLQAACRILFGAEADLRLREYIAEHGQTKLSSRGPEFSP